MYKRQAHDHARSLAMEILCPLTAQLASKYQMMFYVKHNMIICAEHIISDFYLIVSNKMQKLNLFIRSSDILISMSFGIIILSLLCIRILQYMKGIKASKLTNFTVFELLTGCLHTVNL